jgi:hypothetical protein
MGSPIDSSYPEVTRRLLRVIFSYNHADWYVRKVLALAAAYT